VPPRILGITPGDLTWSGTSSNLMGALRRHGALADTVSGRPRWIDRAELAASVGLNRDRWRQSFYAGASPAGPAFRRLTTRIASGRAKARADALSVDATLQLTGWYRVDLPGVLSSAFHDGNLAVTLQRPDLLLDRQSRRVRNALAWERELHDSMDVIFTMSGWLRQSFIEEFEQPPEKVVVAGSGSNLELPAELSRDWDRPRLLFVGYEWGRKGGPDLLAAWPAVRARLPDAELEVVGPSSIGTVPEGVRFRGPIDRSVPGGEEALAQAYHDATAFVLPSRFEPFGNVLLEAMGHGLPCVAANRNAMPEIVEDGVTGRVVDTSDPEALAEALIEVLDPETGARMGPAARERIEKRFTWDVVAGVITRTLAERTGVG
jgi:glycosyltransferase involved in cell wall biosynthesis